jgi:hypothetical protein
MRINSKKRLVFVKQQDNTTALPTEGENLSAPKNTKGSNEPFGGASALLIY